MTRAEVDSLARVLMAAWEKAEGEPVGVSYVATFADMARAALAAQEGERGGAEVAAVEAALPSESESRPLLNEAWPLVTAYATGRWDLAQRIRAVLADPAGALAKHDAEVYERGRQEGIANTGRDVAAAYQTGLKDARRIAGDAS